MVASKQNAVLDVGSPCAAHDQGGAPVNHAVPDLAVNVEGFVAGAAYLPTDLIADLRYEGCFLHVRKLIPNGRRRTEPSGEYLVSGRLSPNSYRMHLARLTFVDQSEPLPQLRRGRKSK